MFQVELEEFQGELESFHSGELESLHSGEAREFHFRGSYRASRIASTGRLVPEREPG